MIHRAAPLNPLLTDPREYPFVRLDRRAKELAPPGVSLIHFGIGDPREETPEFIRATLARSIPKVSSYPTAIGKPELRAAIAGWYQRRYGLVLDPDRHVLPATGTKEAVYLLSFALVGQDASESRRTVVIPSPAYPVYEQSARMAGAQIHFAPLASANAWRFDPAQVPDEVWARTALLWLNDPHNPTGSQLEARHYERVVELSRCHGFWVAGDHAYDELYWGERPRSILEFGFENAIAFHTLSKRSAMTGYRSGFMAGDPRLMEALKRFRPTVGVATPEFVQDTAVAAWNDDAHVAGLRASFAAKRRRMLEFFATCGWQVEAGEATFYLWMKVPDGDDVAFVEQLMRLGVVVTPGSYLGVGGEGFVRWALVPTLASCEEAVTRLAASSDLMRR
ncbi:MAG: aminotransferase class I/II-fold pyridoxal phosphate-dependent enzyme [Candidatus Eisenbacteria bacterium]|uniref:Aminotransferase class I/II-fold pyridoxal phosphate-dependent enzyme n=1 Tax=Eiseniibacteriota bacterium TaxID=2212470 RepID=A0A849SPD1_UNCEI|nr:aminotransferase class I/II-fold pyridoxal phosphate-dependent enzyme [Candidatus Eisenbacteria bacterium]